MREGQTLLLKHHGFAVPPLVIERRLFCLGAMMCIHRKLSAIFLHASALSESLLYHEKYN